MRFAWVHNLPSVPTTLIRQVHIPVKTWNSHGFQSYHFGLYHVKKRRPEIVRRLALKLRVIKSGNEAYKSVCMMPLAVLIYRRNSPDRLSQWVKRASTSRADLHVCLVSNLKIISAPLARTLRDILDQHPLVAAFDWQTPHSEIFQRHKPAIATFI